MKMLIFEISWNPETDAELRFVLDNGDEIAPGPFLDEDRDGRITVEWSSDDQLLHTITWELFAVGATMKDLEAVAHWDDGEPVKLKEKDEQAERWRGRGRI